MDTKSAVKAYQDLHKVFNVYNKGYNHRIVGWNRPESQDYFHSIVLDYLPSTSEKISVLDVGCGVGRLWERLSEKYPQIVYNGVDIVPEFIDIARETFEEDRGKFLRIDVMDLDPEQWAHGWVVACGAFSVESQGGLKWIESGIEKMWSLSEEGVIATFRSAWESDAVELIYYADPMDVLKIAKKFTNHIIMDHSYDPHDFAIILRKRPPQKHF